MLGPVPSRPPSALGAMGLIGFGVVGFFSILLQIGVSKKLPVPWRKAVFFSVVFLFFIVAGLIELAHVK